MEIDVLYKADLDEARRQGCQVPGCAHHHEDVDIFLASQCHRTGGVDVLYRDGVLHLTCHVCDQLIVRVAVADYPVDPLQDLFERSPS